jgi:hypothetical protein
MQHIIYIPNGKKMIFRDVEYQFQGYETIDDNSLFIILSGQFIKFYWNDTTINDKLFASMLDFTNYLDSIL